MSDNSRPVISDAMQYRLITAVTFPFFLAEAALRRAWLIGRTGSLAAPRSILLEAQAASADAMSLAFQG